MENDFTGDGSQLKILNGSVENAQAENPTLAKLEITGIQRIGFKLATWVMIGSGIFIVGLCLFIILTDLDASSKIANLKNADSNLIQSIIQEKKEYRQFLQSTVQSVLINFLLPVLTAILGYIFGTRNER